MEYLSGLVIPTLFTVIILGKVLGWYRAKELDEKRKLDLEILALESGFTFDQYQSYLWRLLRRARAKLNIPKAKYQNVIYGNCGNQHFYLFDFCYRINKTNVNQTGLAISLPNTSFPYFQITKVALGGFLRGDRIKNQKLPGWLHSRVMVTAHVILHAEVVQFINAHSELFESIINLSEFRGIYFGDDGIVLYLNEFYDSRSEEFIKIGSIIDLLYGFGKSELPDVQINLLKDKKHF